MIKWCEAFQAVLDDLIIKNEKGTLEGEHLAIPIEVYHHPLCPGFSRSELTVLNKSHDHLAAYKAQRLEDIKNPPKKNRVVHNIIGGAVHDKLFEPPRFESLYVIPPDEPDVNRKTKAGKEIYDAWNETVWKPWEKANVEKIAVYPDEMKIVNRMVETSFEHPYFKQLHDTELKEVTYFWKDPETGTMLKARPDMTHLVLQVAYDHKSTEDAYLVSFQRSVANYWYHVQAAMQVDGIHAVRGEVFDSITGAQEKEEPFGFILYNMPDAILDVGRQVYKKILRSANETMKDPSQVRGYTRDIVPLGLPGWAFDLSVY
jgi:exodeoxyribonuclease VIII